jgi:hypothetical protein
MISGLRASPGTKIFHGLKIPQIKYYTDFGIKRGKIIVPIWTDMCHDDCVITFLLVRIFIRGFL